QVAIQRTGSQPHFAGAHSESNGRTGIRGKKTHFNNRGMGETGERRRYRTIRRNSRLRGRAERPSPTGNRFLSAHGRLSRAIGRGGQVSRRLSQARRPADAQGNSDGTPHRPSGPAAFP